MNVLLHAERKIRASPEAVYALSIDARRFPAVFPGFGPIPGLRRITLDAPPAVGVTRKLEDNNGLVLNERITALDPGRRHAYTLSGLHPPLAWFVRTGRADWTFAPAGRRHAGRVDLRLRTDQSAGMAAGLAAIEQLHARRDAALPRGDVARARIGSGGAALMEKWILFGMAPVFGACIAVEAWYWRKRRPEIYSVGRHDFECAGSR